VDVKFDAPKFDTAARPGRGERTIFYVEYEITNKSDKPRYISPVLHLVSDKNKTAMTDEVSPAVQDKVRAGLENSVTLCKKPIPPWGKLRAVAIWEGVDVSATQFTVYLRGVSNGFILQDGGTKYKTLQVRFAGEPKGQNIRQSGDAEWVYRASREKP
jgi:hypothetical protein